MSRPTIQHEPGGMWHAGEECTGLCRYPAPAPRHRCAKCGCFVSRRDPDAKWREERGEFGAVLSRWPVACGACSPRLTEDEKDMVGHGWSA